MLPWPPTVFEEALAVRDSRIELIAKGAAQWCDPGSDVRLAARRALENGVWSAPVVEAALASVLADRHSIDWAAFVPYVAVRSARVLAILPGNIIGPAIACAYCAAAAGASLILKASSQERHLAAILEQQFESLGPPLAGTLRARYWPGGDEIVESSIFKDLDAIVAFGADGAIADVSRRAPPGVMLRGYGDAYSIAYVGVGADLSAAAAGVAHDVCMFDQRGCMSPQTVYVQGDEGRALQFGRALADSLDLVSAELPRGTVSSGEQSALAAFVRRLCVTTCVPKTHGLDTLMLGARVAGCPQYVVAVEPAGPPTCAGFGRIVSVKPCAGVEQVAALVGRYKCRLDTLGIAPAASLRDGIANPPSTFGGVRMCELGKMQAPPFGYRPAVADFSPFDNAKRG